ncbi:MAG: tRNA uridine-5-carboxymethylaminomethyl(34) synthesis GTPase MnmE, partial [Candidatus Omnitrophica bacterium]|nr:tRNA uridine-5-carboxymethylaminomethyl(34) synthesis GTPase MnmE [Candidatus Omnitrophota bacterium]
MSEFLTHNDTIVAISTPIGVGAIGIVRLSGPQALTIAEQIFLAKSGRIPSECSSFTVHFGQIVDPRQGKDELMDEVLLTVMRAPHTYTAEDMVEISCHGSPIILQMVLELAMDLGARLAEPGEFTKRAFLNGRLDLTQAEAVIDMIHAKTQAFVRASLHQLKGDLARELEVIREQLMVVYTELEAIINFPEDEIDDPGRVRLAEKLDIVEEKIEELLATSDQGRILKEGIKVVLCGRPNVGKSSLLNVFLKYPRAIVSEIEGTTRDTIEESAQIRGIPLQFIDTAGILEPRDIVEEEAIKRSQISIQAADLILLMLDASRELGPDDDRLIEQVKEQNVLVVVNKRDLP